MLEVRDTKLLILVTLSSIFFFWFGVNFPIFCYLPIYPLIYYALVKKNVYSLIPLVFMLAVSFTLLFSWYFGIFYILCNALIAFFMLWALNNDISTKKIYFTVLLYQIILISIVYFMMFFITGNTLTGIITEVINKYNTNPVYPEFLGSNPELLEKFKDFWTEISKIWDKMKDVFYAIVAIVIAFGFLISYKIGRIFLKNYNIEIKHFFINKTWKPKENLIFGLILGFLFLVLYQTIFKENYFFGFIGKNLTLLFGSIYILNGFMIYHFYVYRFRIPKFFNVLFYILLIFNPYIVFSLGLVGLIDVWFNFRKKVIKKVDKGS